MDLRERVIGDCNEVKTKEVAARYKVSPAWVWRRLKQHRGERGDIVSLTAGGSRGHSGRVLSYSLPRPFRPPGSGQRASRIRWMGPEPGE